MEHSDTIYAKSIYHKVIMMLNTGQSLCRKHTRYSELAKLLFCETHFD